MKNYIETLHSKAVALCEGRIVQCEGHFVRAITISSEECACYNCEMDSACKLEMCALCAECDDYDHKKHILKFAYQH